MAVRPAPLKIYFDGGCRPNPGPMEVALVARGQAWFFDDLGPGPSGDAEWHALLLALNLAHRLGEPVFDLLGDSRAVIEQANGTMPCRTAAARAHRARYLATAAHGAPRRLRWLPRTQNLAGIALARRHEPPSGPKGERSDPLQ